jgi:hypothetical protein
MRSLMERRPSPALVISIVALVVALTGTAVAGVATISKLSKSEKRKVRGLADQEIDKKAPGLAVKSASVAGDVTNQMWAVVSGSAHLVRATGGITGVERNLSDPGKYVVTTNRDLSNCYFLGSIGGPDADVGAVAEISVNPISSASNQLFVHTGSPSANNEDHGFTLLIRC